MCVSSPLTSCSAWQGSSRRCTDPSLRAVHQRHLAREHPDRRCLPVAVYVTSPRYTFNSTDIFLPSLQSPIASPLHPETSASDGTSSSSTRSQSRSDRRTSDGRPRDGHTHGSSLRRRSVPSESKRRRSRLAARRASEPESDDDRWRMEVRWEDRGEETGGRRDTVLSESQMV